MAQDEELMMLDEELKDLTPLGAELIQICKALDCDYECEEKGTCKDKMRCNADLVRAVQELAHILWQKEKTEANVLVRVVKDVEALTRKVELIEQKYPKIFESPPEKTDKPGEFYG